MVRIFLTGYMGAGKTTLGKAFARKMNVPFVDLDWYIEERFHKSVGEPTIPAIVARLFRSASDLPVRRH